MVFKDPPSSVTTYRRLHIQSIIKVIMHSPDSELSPCVFTYLLVHSGHYVCYVNRGQVCVDSNRVSINGASVVRKSEAMQRHNPIYNSMRHQIAAARCYKKPKALGTFSAWTDFQNLNSCMVRLLRDLMFSELEWCGIG